MRRWRKASALTLLAALGLALSGCSQSPLAPENPSSNAGTGPNRVPPPIVSFEADGSTVDYVTAPVDTAVDAVVNLAGGLPTSLKSTMMVDGSRGGMLRAGRFSVKVLPGAFSGTATVTLSMPDSNLMICDLSISPASANRFKIPAQLTADFSSSSITDVSTLTTYWYDPTHITWVNLSARSRTTGSVVTTALDHFSTYGSGKAGW
jgi:hypothetical protein